MNQPFQITLISMINFQSKKYLLDQQVRKLPYKPKYWDIPFEQVPTEIIVILMENASRQLMPLQRNRKDFNMSIFDNTLPDLSSNYLVMGIFFI